MNVNWELMIVMLRGEYAITLMDHTHAAVNLASLVMESIVPV